jgi:hypothetical protein
MKQAQKMQADMLKAQEELENESVQASVGGGSVTVTMTGKFQVTEVRIDAGAIDPDDPQMLEDLVMAAMNEAVRQAQDLAEKKLGAVTGGMGGPGGGLGGLL